MKSNYFSSFVEKFILSSPLLHLCQKSVLHLYVGLSVGSLSLICVNLTLPILLNLDYGRFTLNLSMK